MEYAATLGLSTDAGKAYVGNALELRYRLPRLWAHTVAGRLPVWRALRVAEHTCCLPPAAAAEVDRALAPVAGTCSWAQLDRLVEEALARHDPAEAEDRRRRAADGRRFDVETDRADTSGTVEVHGRLDLADALDLDAAISKTADPARRPRVDRAARRAAVAGRRGARPPPARPRPHHRRTDQGVWSERGAQRPPHRGRAGRGRERRSLRHHPHPGDGGADPRVVPHRRPDPGGAGEGPHRPPPRRGLRDPRPPASTRSTPATCTACSPTANGAPSGATTTTSTPTTATAPAARPVHGQHCAVVPATSPGEDPRPLDLPTDPRHRLRVDHPARLPDRPRPPRHPRSTAT